ncbi:uncharacterized protein Dere_GG22398, partial [Drosophila erecta]
MCRICSSLMKFHGCTSHMERHKCYRTKVLSPNTEDPLGPPARIKNSGGFSADKATDKVTQAVMEWCLPTSCSRLQPDDDLFSDFIAMDSQEDKIVKEMQGYQAI